MPLRTTRRDALLTAAAAISAAPVTARNATSGNCATTPTAAFAELERRNRGRLGVAVLDTGSGQRLQHRENERFAMCSTFKFLAAAAILQRVDQGRDRLDRPIPYTESDLLEYAPVSKEHVKEGNMSLAEICAAAVQWSDNTAANLIFQILAGPAGLTRFILQARRKTRTRTYCATSRASWSKGLGSRPEPSARQHAHSQKSATADSM